MFGGLSQSWIAESVALLERDEDVLCVNPLPGPPPTGGRLPEAVSDRAQVVGRDAYRFEHVSSRIFLVDLERLRSRVCPLYPLRERSVRIFLGALRARRDNFVLPEHVISHAMREAGMYRVDILGESPGMWAVHPVTRTRDYFDNLEGLIQRLERNSVTEEQRGQYNLVESMLKLS